MGSAIGPVAYVIAAGDLNTTTPRNSLCKFADDPYLIIPASNEHSRLAELASIPNWALLNNLKLTSNKSCEIIFLTTDEAAGHHRTRIDTRNSSQSQSEDIGRGHC